MAKKSASRKGNGSNGDSQSNDDWAVPEGFNINVGRDRGDGWVTKKEGNTILGRLLGRYTYESRGKKRAYYQVKLYKPCEAEAENPDYNDEDEDAMEEAGIEPTVTVTLQAGQVVNVDESAKLADLESHASNGGVYDVWFVYGPKIDLDKGRTMWTVIGPKLKMVEKPSEIPF
jgi:hypothetical protein